MIILTPQDCPKCNGYEFEPVSEGKEGTTFRCIECDEAFIMDVSHQYAIVSDLREEPDIKWKGTF
jgi:hypothetical protein